MDKLSIIRSMYTEEIDHQQATYYAITGHRPNSALESPSLGSIIARELSPRRNMPPYVIAPPIDRPYLNYFNAGFIGARYQPMVVPDPAREDFQVPDLVLPKEIGMDRVSHRRSFLEVVDRLYRHQEQQAEFAALDDFRQQALTILGFPAGATGVRSLAGIGEDPGRVRPAPVRPERAAGAPADRRRLPVCHGRRIRHDRVGPLPRGERQVQSGPAGPSLRSRLCPP